ncbi:MAG: T9SS type A sorting domain-containing protein [Bacteroidota bacterium]
MKHILLLYLFFVFIAVKGQQWDWAKSSSNISYLGAHPITTDKAGNTYEAILLHGNLTIDSLMLNGSPSGIGIIKYDTYGKILWGKSFVGNGYPFPQTITHDNYGNVYVGGSFSGDSLKIDSVVLTKNVPNGCDGFLVKLDSLGGVVWAKGIGGGRNETMESVVTDQSGNIYMSGVFSNTISLDSVFSSEGGNDIYVLKINAQGNTLWVKILGASQNESSKSLALDAFGNLYLSGSFNDSLFIVGTDAMLNHKAYGSDIFIAKFDPLGNISWSKSIGGTGNDYTTDLKVDLSGNIYMTGYFHSPSITLGNTTLNNPYAPQSRRIFVVKYNSIGNILWTQTAEGATSANALAIDSKNNLYVVGNCGAGAIFGADTLKKTMNPPSRSRLFIAKYDSNGNSLWAKGAGSRWDATAGAVSCDAIGNVYITGSFNDDSLHFGNVTLINANFPYFYYFYDMFIAKLKVMDIVGIPDFELKKDYSMYPNPSSGIISVSLEMSDVTKVCVYDLLGNCVYDKKKKQDEQDINLSGLAKGVYLLELTSDKQKISKKIVLQ